MKLFIVVNVDWFFLSHRLPIALAAQKAGYNVTILARNTGRKEEIISYGLNFIHVPFSRSGTNLIQEGKVLYHLIRIYQDHRPDIVHHVTLKVAIYGSIAARWTGIPQKINAISGMGYNFIENRRGGIQRILLQLMKFAFEKGDCLFIFQNIDDIESFKTLSLVEESQIHLIKGSGVDLNEYVFQTIPESFPIKILFSARLLLDKGIIEFVKAAKELKSKLYGKAVFLIAGNIDKENPTSITSEMLKDIQEESYIEWIGYQKNMFECLSNSHICVLPSYREGLPKSLIEACAVGRPIITTDAPGCKECVIDGWNGFLVPVKDSTYLMEKIYLLTENRGLIEEMGMNSRLLAEREFNINTVIEKTLATYHN